MRFHGWARRSEPSAAMIASARSRSRADLRDPSIMFLRSTPSLENSSSSIDSTAGIVTSSRVKRRILLQTRPLNGALPAT